MKKLLVTGANGFIGRSVLRAAASGNFELHAVYNSHKPVSIEGVQWHQCDLLNEAEVSQLFASLKPACLVQLAWCTGQTTYWKDPANLNWISTNLHLAKQFQANGGERCVFAGTSAEYDWKGAATLNETTTALSPLLLYGSSKLSVYWALKGFFEQEKISFAWARFFNPFGPGEDFRRLIPKTCLALLEGKTLQFDAALSLRDFLHVDEVGSAVISVLKSSVTGPVNIASGEGITVRKLIENIANNYNLIGQVSFAEATPPQNFTDSVVADTGILNDACGWHPSKNFSEHLAATCRWWKNQNTNQLTDK